MMETVVTSVSVLGIGLALVVWDIRRAVKLDRQIRRELFGQTETQQPAEEKGDG